VWCPHLSQRGGLCTVTSVPKRACHATPCSAGTKCEINLCAHQIMITLSGKWASTALKLIKEDLETRIIQHTLVRLK
jgi:hypothetical protein